MPNTTTQGFSYPFSREPVGHWVLGLENGLYCDSTACSLPTLFIMLCVSHKYIFFAFGVKTLDSVMKWHIHLIECSHTAFSVS